MAAFGRNVQENKAVSLQLELMPGVATPICHPAVLSFPAFLGIKSSNHRHAGEKDEDDKPLKFGRPLNFEGTASFCRLGVTFSSKKETIFLEFHCGSHVTSD